MRFDGCWAVKGWARDLMALLFWKLVLTLLVALLLFEVMVTGFHQLNLPSDRAVMVGVGLLLSVAVGGFIALGRIWKLK